MIAVKDIMVANIVFCDALFNEGKGNYSGCAEHSSQLEIYQFSIVL